MIYDPTDVNMAMDEHGRLLYLGADQEWTLYEEVNFRGEFRRPEW